MFFAGIAGILMPYLLILCVVFAFTFAQKTEDLSTFPIEFKEHNLAINPGIRVELQEDCFCYENQFDNQDNFIDNLELLRIDLVNIPALRETLEYYYLNTYKSNSLLNFSGSSPPCLV